MTTINPFEGKENINPTGDEQLPLIRIFIDMVTIPYQDYGKLLIWFTGAKR